MNIIKVIDTSKADKKASMELLKHYRTACLYEINKKPLIHIVANGKHIRYMCHK